MAKLLLWKLRARVSIIGKRSRESQNRVTRSQGIISAKLSKCEHLFTATGGYIWQSGKAAACLAVNTTSARPTIDNKPTKQNIVVLPCCLTATIPILPNFYFSLGGPTALTNSCSHKIKQGESGNHTTTHMVAWVGTNFEILSGHAPNRLLFRN